MTASLGFPTCPYFWGMYISPDYQLSIITRMYSTNAERVNINGKKGGTRQIAVTTVNFYLKPEDTKKECDVDRFPSA